MNCKIFVLILISISLFQISGYAQIDNLPMSEGKFKATDESLVQYKYPE